MKRIVLLALCLVSCMYSGGVYADTIISGDLVVRDGGKLYFQDGTFQSTACPPPAPLTITAICEAIKANGKSLPDFCPNTPPIANAGSNQKVAPSLMVTLDGSGSYDPDNNPITYSWTLVSKPVGSISILSNLMGVVPTFTPDLEGIYVVGLVVNDGKVNSSLSTVIITATSPSSVGGIIITDTTWDISNSPYTISSNIQVGNNATLKIDPGVLVYSKAGNNIELVSGNLIVSGTELYPVTMKTGLIIDENSSATVSYANIDSKNQINNLYTISLYGSNLLLYNSILSKGIYISGTSIDGGNINITRNVIRDGYIVIASNYNINIKNNQLCSAYPNVVMYVTDGRNTTMSLNSINGVVRLQPDYRYNKLDARYNYWNTSDKSIVNTMIYDRNDDLNVANYVLYDPILNTADINTPQNILCQ